MGSLARRDDGATHAHGGGLAFRNGPSLRPYGANAVSDLGRRDHERSPRCLSVEAVSISLVRHGVVYGDSQRWPDEVRRVVPRQGRLRIVLALSERGRRIARGQVRAL